MNTIAFLAVLIFYGPGNGHQVKYYKMTDLATCYESVKNSSTTIANGGDSEGGISLYCVQSVDEKGKP